jgi:glycosyltransferase involved in cell wall biosynthesis
VKISLITVAYNSEATIKETIQSVLFQSFHNVEYIIVDGASKDKTVSIIMEYEPLFNGRLRWISEPDNGLYDAINKGIRMATGEIVGIINSDDFYHKDDRIALVAEAFEDKTVQAVFGDVRFVHPDHLEKTVRYYSSRSFNPGKFSYGFMPAHPTFFTYKYFFDEYGYYKVDYEIAADYELLIRFLYTRKLKYHYMSIDLLKMRTGGISTASLKSNYILNKEIVRACKENGIYTNIFFLGFKYFYKIFELVFCKP